MAEATSNEGDLDFWVELRQAKEGGWNHFWKCGFHKVWSFPKNSVAPDKNISFSYITAKTMVSKSNHVQPALTRNPDRTTKTHYSPIGFPLSLLGKNIVTDT